MAGMQQSLGDKRRAYAGPAFFSHGFRPFFLCASLFAGLAVPLWMVVFSHGYSLGPNGNALEWHAHEMIFGYVGAVVAGFILTAIPNWTGRLPVVGLRLAVLFTLWLTGRTAVFFGGEPVIIAIIDCLFLVAIAGFAWREVLAGKNWRNVPVCVLISLLAVSNALDHAGPALNLPHQFGQRLALTLVTILMMLIGGRIIPSFTTNWMKRQGLSRLPIPFDPFDKLVLLLSVPVLVGWIAAPGSFVIGIGLLAIAFLHAIRLLRWRGWLTTRDPLVLVLHVAYAWIPVALTLMGLSILRPDIITATHALHAMTAGAIGQLTMAVMTRATLGHSGRELRAGAGTVTIFLLIFVGATLRVGLPFAEFKYAEGVSIAGMVWAAGFVLFAILYGPMLFAKRR